MPRHSSQLAAAALLVVVSVSSQPTAICAEGDEVEGSGESAVIGDNVASARRRALVAASEDAVARAATGLIGAELALREPSKLRTIRERAQRYLRTYRVLEERQQGARFLLKLAAKIDERRLRQELFGLGLTPARGAVAPTLRLILSGSLGQELRLHRGASEGGEQAQFGAALRSALAREGFSSELGSGSRSCPPSASCLVGGLRVESGEEVRGIAMAAVRVELSLSLAPISKRSDGWGWGEPELAARRALERALPDALAPILAELRRRHPPAPRAIRLSGLTELGQLDGIERALRESSGVIGCRLREVARGEARFEVETALDARALGAALEKLRLHRGASEGGEQAQLQPPGFSLTISGIEGGTVWLTLRPATGPGTAR